MFGGSHDKEQIVRYTVDNFKVAYPGDTILAVSNYEYKGTFQPLFQDDQHHNYIVKLPHSDSPKLEED